MIYVIVIAASVPWETEAHAEIIPLENLLCNRYFNLGRTRNRKTSIYACNPSVDDGALVCAADADIRSHTCKRRASACICLYLSMPWKSCTRRQGRGSQRFLGLQVSVA